MTIVGRDADYDTVVSGGRLRSTVATMEEANESDDDDEVESVGPPATIVGEDANNDDVASVGHRRPNPPLIIVETVDEDGSTGEEFPITSEDDFATDDERGEGEEDSSTKHGAAVPRVHKRATRPKSFADLWSAPCLRRGAAARNDNKRRLGSRCTQRRQP